MKWCIEICFFRLLFDDFAVAPIPQFADQISVFRADNISTCMLIQSYSQLIGIYGAKEADVIRNNCAKLTYFTGSMSIEACQDLAIRMGKTTQKIMELPLGKIIEFSSGRKYRMKNRYNIYEDPIFLRIFT